MCYIAKGEGQYQYLVSAAALEGETEYRSWQYDDFLASFLTVCHKVALQKPPTVEQANGELALKRMELAEVEKQIGRLVDFLAQGSSGAVETKLREVELKKIELQHQVAELENEAAAKPMDSAKVNWKDSNALRDNLRATVKRITVDAKARAFKAEFLDGRVYEFKRDGETVTINTPDEI
jgi:hypothetical protein